MTGSERQRAPWLPQGAINKVGRISPRKQAADKSPASRRLPWEERRAQLLQACLETFVAMGLEMTTMDTIAARAGVSKPLVYRHFHNRFEALMAVVDQQADLLMARVRAPLRPGAGSELDSVIQGFLAFAGEAPGGFRLLFHLVDGSPGPAKRRLDELRDGLGGTLTRALVASLPPALGLEQAISESRVGHLMVSILEGVAGCLAEGEDPALVAQILTRLLRPDRVAEAVMPNQVSALAERGLPAGLR